MSPTPRSTHDGDALDSADDDAGPDELLGTLISGRYRIQRLMGKGGMGAVYSARQEAMERDVAIKVLLPVVASDRRATKRFLAEARIAGGLGHPNVVDVYDLGTLDDGRPFLVMPKLHGKSLHEVLQAHHRLPAPHTAAVVRAIASALDAMHSCNIIHRDLKPDNLFLAQQPDGTDVVKLLDFGLATLLGDGKERLTRAGMIVGTPEYMPPEAGDGRMVDVRGDVYSLACIAYEALTGEIPIDGPTPTAQLLRKMSSDAPPLATFVRGFSAEIEAAVARGLARKPEDRFQTAGEFADAFVAAVEATCGRPPRVLRLTKTDIERVKNGGAPAPIPLTSVSRPQVIAAEPLDVAPVAPSAHAAPPSTGVFRRAPQARAVRMAVAAVIAILLLLAAGALGGLLLRSMDAERPDANVARVTTPVSPVQVGTPPAPSVPTEVDQAPQAQEAPSAPPPTTREPRGEGHARPNGPSTNGASTSAPVVATAPSPTPPVAPSPSPGTNDAPAIRGSGEANQRTLDRERATALASEGTSLLVSGRLPAAVDKFLEATQANPGNATAWRGLGLAYQRMGRAPEARSAYQRYLRIAPNARDADMIRARLDEL